MNIKTLYIQILWSDNDYLHNLSIEHRGRAARVFTSFEAIDRAFIRGASFVIKAGRNCCNKIGFILTYGEDQYSGRFDLSVTADKQKINTRDISLKQHMQDHCKFAVDYHVELGASALVPERKKWLEYLELM